MVHLVRKMSDHLRRVHTTPTSRGVGPEGAQALKHRLPSGIVEHAAPEFHPAVFNQTIIGVPSPACASYDLPLKLNVYSSLRDLSESVMLQL